MSKRKHNAAVFILSHGRPDKVFTYDTLRRSGYSGPIYIIVDSGDKTVEEYKKKFGASVIVFDKADIAKRFDVGDNFPGMRGVVYARNANFEIAKKLGYEYFIQLDDDYRHFQFRFDGKHEYRPKVIKNLDRIFDALLEFYITSGADSLAISQGGDFIGGEDASNASQVKLSRKLMNFFVCSPSRPFSFIGRINEDVNVYVKHGNVGRLFFTTNQLSLEQVQTQSSSGGMTELYLDEGTYIKSFYSVIYLPSAVKIGVLEDRLGPRLHHRVAWKYAVPKILAGK